MIHSPCPSLHDGVSFLLPNAAENLHVRAGGRGHAACTCSEPSLGSDGIARVTFVVMNQNVSDGNKLF